jgi:multiple sugar transport system substrate-binding protein
MKRIKWLAPAIALPLVIAALTGCTSSSSSATTTKQDAKSPITIWVDGTRLDLANKWKTAHPEYKATVESVDGVTQKVALAVKAGRGIPDIIFLGEPSEISTLLTNSVNYPLALNDLVTKKKLDGFAPGTVAKCTYNDKVYCLPNDTAQTVMYYNKTLFDKWGYTVPTTFSDWEALSEKVAAEHPGYSLGTMNGRYGLDGYFGSSGCEYNDASSATAVKINLTSNACARVTDVMGRMVKSGTLSTLDFFDTAYIKTISDGHLLAAIAPSWMGLYGIKPNYKAEGDYAVAAMPKWKGADTNYSGAVGGGLWVAYSGTKNQKAVADFMTTETTDNAYIATGPGYPAYSAAANEWLKTTASDPWYAEDPSVALKYAAGKISPTLGFVRYQPQIADSYTNLIVKNAGGDLASAVSSFGDEITQAAKAAGYKVSK